MDTTYIPHPQDSKLQMETAITKTATFAGTSFSLGTGFNPGDIGMPAAVVVQITALKTSVGDEAYTMQLMESADGVSWTQAGPAIVVDARLRHLGMGRNGLGGGGAAKCAPGDDLPGGLAA